MKKYWAIFLTSLKNSLNYRGELMLWSIIDAMPLVGNLVLWSVVFVGQDSIGGLSARAVIGYYLVGYIFANLTGSHFEDHYVKEIKSGNFSSLLFKPFSVKKALVWEEVSWRVVGSIIMLLPILIPILVIDPSLLTMPNPRGLFTLVLILPLAYLIEAISSLAIIAMAFIFDEARSLIHLKWMLGWLFSGSMIPFELMPTWLAKLSYALPFQSRYHLPTAIYQNTIDLNTQLQRILITATWSVVLYIALKILWNTNLKKFSAVGS